MSEVATKKDVAELKAQSALMRQQMAEMKEMLAVALGGNVADKSKQPEYVRAAAIKRMIPEATSYYLAIWRAKYGKPIDEKDGRDNRNPHYLYNLPKVIADARNQGFQIKKVA